MKQILTAVAVSAVFIVYHLLKPEELPRIVGADLMTWPMADTCKPDTVILYVSVDPKGPEQWQSYIDKGLTVVFTLPETGGTAMLPDSTTYYNAVFGALPPHVRLKDSVPRVYRFIRASGVNGRLQVVRFTLYKSGAWIREMRDATGEWAIVPY